MIECPIVADPKPKLNRPPFGCSFVAMGLSDVQNISMHYLESGGDEEVTIMQGLGMLHNSVGLLSHNLHNFITIP